MKIVFNNKTEGVKKVKIFNPLISKLEFLSKLHLKEIFYQI